MAFTANKALNKAYQAMNYAVMKQSTVRFDAMRSCGLGKYFSPRPETKLGKKIYN